MMGERGKRTAWRKERDLSFTRIGFSVWMMTV
jgi:hypothetical protein